ncbi:unannotated protein [freshwater metagenome]|uniref:Unannotated protein n=1 Tax=freshwater metagenome TaxID=449393 RepID=A0A6J7H2P8_9ZZZZ
MQHCVRSNHHTLTSAMRAPAKIEVITKERELRIKSIHAIPQVAANQHASRTHGKYVSITIVLTLVVFASL